jgi:hypothetical protein
MAIFLYYLLGFPYLKRETKPSVAFASSLHALSVPSLRSSQAASLRLRKSSSLVSALCRLCCSASSWRSYSIRGQLKIRNFVYSKNSELLEKQSLIFFQDMSWPTSPGEL